MAQQEKHGTASQINVTALLQCQGEDAPNVQRDGDRDVHHQLKPQTLLRVRHAQARTHISLCDGHLLRKSDTQQGGTAEMFLKAPG